MSTRARIEIAQGVARVALDDGKVNAISSGMIAEIGAALDAAEKAGAIVVLRGREGIFSAGFDLKEMRQGPQAALEMVGNGGRLVERLLAFPQPVLTACTGHAYPAGAFLMLAADVRLGIEGPFQIGMNEVAIGLTPPRYAFEIARHRLTPAGFARITTAGMFAPEEARQLGYLDRVVPPEALDAAVEEELARLFTLDRPSFTATKGRVNAPSLEAFRAALEADFGAARATPA